VVAFATGNATLELGTALQLEINCKNAWQVWWWSATEGPPRCVPPVCVRCNRRMVAVWGARRGNRNESPGSRGGGILPGVGNSSRTPVWVWAAGGVMLARGSGQQGPARTPVKPNDCQRSTTYREGSRWWTSRGQSEQQCMVCVKGSV